MTEALKLAKLNLRAVKAREDALLMRQIIASPLVQIVGTVLISEAAEKCGLLSANWANALEGGVIAMIGLQALKDYGVLGPMALGLGIGAGGLVEPVVTGEQLFRGGLEQLAGGVMKFLTFGK